MRKRSGRYQAAPWTVRAFTLVELLVVIGIIALLIAILLPSLAAARRAAMMVSCASNQRQIGIAVLTFAQDHKGYAPLAGFLNFDASPDSLTDSSMRRYAYMRLSNGRHKPAPFPAALAPYMGYQGDLTDYDGISAAFQGSSGLARIFRCGSAAERQKLGRFIEDGGDGTYAPGIYADYAVNEAVLGWQVGTPTPRLHGQIDKAVTASETLLLGDGQPRTEWAPDDVPDNYLVWYNYLGGKSTLGDALRYTNGGTPSVFDLNRHNGRMNVLLLDGHVEAVTIDVGHGQNDSELDRILLYQPR
jgi:prepilin-type processing-associated H-X9-DG protein/prepilin-type N-terminal cleavage/methylation domain-containing protein